MKVEPNKHPSRKETNAKAKDPMIVNKKVINIFLLHKAHGTRTWKIKTSKKVLCRKPAVHGCPYMPAGPAQKLFMEKTTAKVITPHNFNALTLSIHNL